MIRTARRLRSILLSCSLALAATVAAGCGAETGFSETRARAHVRELATTIGSRPAGSEANRRAREYVSGELRRLGFDVRVQEADATRPEAGATTRVFNIIGVRRGSSPEAVALVTHYDSPPESPGAADDGLGVAVLLEAARALVDRADPRWTLVAAVTDAEELGLMGAAALVADPVMAQVRAYLNLEAVGTTGPSLLFQTGPGNAWLVEAWAAAAPWPAGNSITTEIYERLPNDTDFTIIRRLGIPGLNFAPVGDSEAYHTPRDTEANLSGLTLQTTGDNVVAIVRALDNVDIRQRAPEDHATYFDLGEMAAVVYGPRITAIVAWLAVALGALAWLKVVAAGIRMAGLGRVLLGFVWTALGVALAVLAMTAVVWLLRASTPWLHPWYARPGLFVLLIVAAGLLAWWALVQLASLVAVRWRGSREAACQWAVALPVWMALAVLAQAMAPGAGFAVTWPLLVAGLGLLVMPVRTSPAIRVVSLAVLAVAALLSLPSAVRLLLFASPMFGRLPVVMPAYVYPALTIGFATLLLPPLLAALPAGARGRLASRAAGVPLALLVLALLLGSWGTAGYSRSHPHQRAARYVNVAGAPGRPAVEYWEVGGNERDSHADLLVGHPGAGAWRSVDDAPAGQYRVGRLRRAFVSRLERPASVPFPGRATAATEAASAGTPCLAVRVTPDSPTATVVLELPPGVEPAAANYPGRVVDGRWRASYTAPPPGGVEFRLALRESDRAALTAVRVAIVDGGLPGGVGWQMLPPWLPQERDAWTARSVFVTELSIEN